MVAMSREGDYFFVSAFIFQYSRQYLRNWEWKSDFSCILDYFSVFRRDVIVEVSINFFIILYYIYILLLVS